MTKPSEPQLSVAIHTTFDENLATAWRDLESRCDHYGFQSHQWLSHWQQTVGTSSGIAPTVAVVSEGSETVALFPLGIRRVAGVRVLAFLGGGQSDYNAVLVAPESSGVAKMVRIWKAVLEKMPRHDVRSFSRLPARLPQGPNPALRLWDSVAAGKASAASLANSWEDQLARISKRVRSDSKRQLRKVEAQGALKFCVASEWAEFDEIASTMIEQKRRRYLETGVRDAFADEATRDFYRGLHGSLGARGRIHLSALRVDDAIIATHWGMIYDDHFYYLQPTYAAGIWRSLSAGRLLQERLMEWAIENGLRWFDFSVGDEPYKRIWCDSEMELYESEAAVSIAGRAYLAAAGVVGGLKRNKTTRALITATVRTLRGGAPRPPKKDPSKQ